MSVPKSVTTIKRNGSIEFKHISNADRIQYTMRELMRGALRDVGKYLKKQYNNYDKPNHWKERSEE